ncbi:hypothetical protein BDN72DRAFT_903358 [Pluteus cervinus]|uniref:Uncharacterized protein n=1 Tax=Pluteus cervinus TaxID=181527 RepID=A0ACD3AA67_9AGAR|nr:hypothetical protein BDN72DRAFT_903358 [Pluteus cervinus]
MHVHISPETSSLQFSLGGETLFEAPINEEIIAYVAGDTMSVSGSAHRSISTLPANQTLWHRRFARALYTKPRVSFVSVS